MAAVLPSNRFNRTSFMALLLCFVVMFGLVSSVLAKPASAKTVRLALVTSLGGDVTVKKGGGSKIYDAYENMSLNQGDTLYTGDDSYVTLDVSSGDAEVTVGANSEFNISDLAVSGGKKSKFKMWAGSMWVKVKSLAGSNDEFEVETPTAVMGVRGTHFWQSVDPVTGRTSMVVASGVVRATTVTATENEETRSSLQESKFVNVYPAQQIVLDSRTQVPDLKTKVDTIDINAIVQQSSAKVIEKMVAEIADIQRENEQFIERLLNDFNNGIQRPTNQANLQIRDMNDLSRISNNFDNIVGNIAKQAINQKKVEKATMDKIVEEANKKIEDPQKKLDLNKVKELDKSAGLDPAVEKAKQEELKRLEEERKKKQEEEQRKQEEVKKKLDAVLKQVEEERKKIEEANKKAAEEAKAKAEAELKKQLSDAEKVKFEQNKKNSASPSPSPTPAPTPAPDHDNPDTSTPVEPLPALVELYAPETVNAGGVLELGIDLNNFVNNNQFYAVEVHLLYDDALAFKRDREPSSAIFLGEDSVQSIREFRGLIGTSYQRELVYAATKFGIDQQIEVINKKRLVALPLQVNRTSGTVSVHLSHVAIVQKDGTRVNVHFDPAVKSIRIGT